MEQEDFPGENITTLWLVFLIYHLLSIDLLIGKYPDPQHTWDLKLVHLKPLYKSKSSIILLILEHRVWPQEDLSVAEEQRTLNPSTG